MPQLDLFGAPIASLPEGFRYATDVVPRAMQDELLGQMPALPFKAFDFHGFEGKRRVCSFGWKYGFRQPKIAPDRGNTCVPPARPPARRPLLRAASGAAAAGAGHRIRSRRANRLAQGQGGVR